MHGSHVTGSERTSAYIERVWVQHSTNTNSSNSSSGWRELDTPSQKTTHAHKTPKKKVPTHARAHSRTDPHVHTLTRTHNVTHVHRFTHTHARTHINTHTHVHTHILTHTHTRTYSTDSCSDGRRDHFDRLLQLGARGFFRKLSFCDAAVAVNDDGVRLLIHQGGVKPNSKPHIGWARHLKEREQYGAR